MSRLTPLLYLYRRARALKVSPREVSAYLRALTRHGVRPWDRLVCTHRFLDLTAQNMGLV